MLSTPTNPTAAAQRPCARACVRVTTARARPAAAAPTPVVPSQHLRLPATHMCIHACVWLLCVCVHTCMCDGCVCVCLAHSSTHLERGAPLGVGAQGQVGAQLAVGVAHIRHDLRGPVGWCSVGGGAALATAAAAAATCTCCCQLLLLASARLLLPAHDADAHHACAPPPSAHQTHLSRNTRGVS
jgi:hypothetical protein